MKKVFRFLPLLFLSGCLGYPEAVTPVSGFQLQSYLGTWYEIARLDHSFERGLSNVTAEYSMREDGGVKVVNRGFSAEKGTWKEATGRAYFVKGDDTGYLKVSFFGPFYGSYVIFDLDPDAYSFVCGPDMSYLWLLARTPTVSENLKQRFVATIDPLGFDTSELIWVDQDKHEE